jgi:hypothetical protein
MRKPTSLLILGLAAASWSLTAAEPDLTKLPPPSDQKGLTYAKDIHPILEGSSCFRCHGEDRQKGGLRLDSLEELLKGGEDGKILTVGKSQDSSLVVAVAQLDDETAMPPKPRARGGRGFGPGNMLAPQMVLQGDKDGDKKLSKAEFTGLADAWFDKMDSAKTGNVSQNQFVYKLGEILPAPRGRAAGSGGPGGPPQGGGRAGFSPAKLIGPGMFTAVDANKDHIVTRAELKSTFGKWYTQWDADKSDALPEAKIAEGLTAVLPQPNFGPGPGGPGGPGGPEGGPEAGGRPGGPGGPDGGRGGGRPGGGPDGPGRGGPGGGGPGGGPPATPLTTEQVALVRAWIDQGAK